MIRLWKLFLCLWNHVPERTKYTAKYLGLFDEPVYRCIRCGELYSYDWDASGAASQEPYTPTEEEPFL